MPASVTRKSGPLSSKSNRSLYCCHIIRYYFPAVTKLVVNVSLLLVSGMFSSAARACCCAPRRLVWSYQCYCTRNTVLSWVRIRLMRPTTRKTGNLENLFWDHSPAGWVILRNHRTEGSLDVLLTHWEVESVCFVHCFFLLSLTRDDIQRTSGIYRTNPWIAGHVVQLFALLKKI